MNLKMDTSDSDQETMHALFQEWCYNMSLLDLHNNRSTSVDQSWQSLDN